MGSVIKVLHLSTHDEDCGVGKYQEMFLDTLSDHEGIENKFFDLSPNQIKVMNDTDLEKTMKQLSQELADYDILHIQHEFSFFYKDEFQRIVDVAQALHKKIIVTLHASPYVAYKPPKLLGLGPHSMVGYAKAIRLKRKFFKNFVAPMKEVDMIVVHNQVTKDSMASLGVDRERIVDLVIPVPAIDHAPKSKEIHDALRVKDKDIVYATVGFLHKFKGIKPAVKALKYLPENYKLAIIGGVHPQADNEAIYDEITDLIDKLGLIDRVYITGFVRSDEKMNALVRECDICVYPYDKTYYSHVSSASLNNAFANHVPIVAYPTESFKEINTHMPALTLTQSCSYYEMAKSLKALNIVEAKKQSKDFAQSMSYPKIAPQIISFYEQLLSE